MPLCPAAPLWQEVKFPVERWTAASEAERAFFETGLDYCFVEAFKASLNKDQLIEVSQEPGFTKTLCRHRPRRSPLFDVRSSPVIDYNSHLQRDRKEGGQAVKKKRAGCQWLWKGGLRLCGFRKPASSQLYGLTSSVPPGGASATHCLSHTGGGALPLTITWNMDNQPHCQHLCFALYKDCAFNVKNNASSLMPDSRCGPAFMQGSGVKGYAPGSTSERKSN
ncbi:hypothetical protein DNTS_032532 [Danionella cerebrum]|uniref:Uncharacterized protein n=1 Tax=Danionella cerebrum TaxID=2873325 RepID=A0A553R249_9TELE|nr:hypothetical protein DNTS_032532 [Danionella translucida]